MSRAIAVRITRDVELMDAGHYDAKEISESLADLRLYNALGPGRLVRREVARLLAGAGSPRRVSVLDIATGSADIPARLVRWGARHGVQMQAAGMDVNQDVLGEAIRYLARDGARVNLVQGNALSLPHADRSVDLVICSTFLHHLETEEARQALAEMKRVARLGIVVTDLVRSRVTWAIVWLLTRLTSRNRLTRNDGPLSVRRSFTPGEMAEVARAAGLAGAVVRRADPVHTVLSWSVSSPGRRP
jgi:SAM-dependent methyltransferase